MIIWYTEFSGGFIAIVLQRLQVTNLQWWYHSDWWRVSARRAIGQVVAYPLNSRRVAERRQLLGAWSR